MVGGHEMKPKEAAQRLGITYRTLQNWDFRGILKAHRTLTGRRYYTEEQIKGALKNGTKM